MNPQVTLPIRLRLDPAAATGGAYRAPLRAALARAAARAAATAPIGAVAAPAVRWHGPGLAGLPAEVRLRVEREIGELIAELCPAPAAGTGGGGGFLGLVPRLVSQALLGAAPAGEASGFTTDPRSAYDLAEEGRPALWLTEAMTVREAAERLYGRPDDWQLLVYGYNRDLWLARHDAFHRPGDLGGERLRPGQRLRVEPLLLRPSLRTRVQAAVAARVERELDHTGGARLTAETDGPVPRGSTVRIGLHLPADAYPVRAEWEVRPDPVYRATSLVPPAAAQAGPRGELTAPGNTEPHRWDLRAEAVGVHTVACRLYRDGEFWQEVSTSLLVLNPEDLARIVLRSGAAPTTGLAALRRARQAELDLRLGALTADPREHGDRPFLVAEPAGEVTPGSTVRYHLRLPNRLGADAELAWTVLALDPPAPGDGRGPLGRGLDALARGLFERHTAPTGWLRGGRRHNDFWEVTWDRPGSYEIGCLVSGHPAPATVVQQVRERVGSRPTAPPPLPRLAQAGLTADLAFVDRTLARGEAVPLRAAWVTGESEPVAVPLSLYATTVPDAPAGTVRLRIWDHSPAGARRHYEGSGTTPAEALDAALRDLARTPYPLGAILVDAEGFTLAGREYPARTTVVRTNGGMPLADFLATFSTFLFVTGAALSIAGAPYVGGPLIAVSQVGGGAAAVARLHDRGRSGTLLADQQLLLDLLDLGGNLTGAVGRGAGLLKVEAAGGLRFVAELDGGLGKVQLLVGNLGLAAKLDAAVKAGDRRQITEVLLEAVRTGALLKLGGLADRAAEDGQPAHPAAADEARPVVVRHATVDPRFVAALPPELRGSVEVVEDGGHTVQVRYDFDRFGRMKVTVLAGPDATPEDAGDHLATIGTLKEYDGVRGRIRIIADRAGAMLRGEVEPMHFTRAWDARAELAKLDPVIERLERRWWEPGVRERLADLKRQRAEHRRTLAELDSRPGGVIAAEDRREDGSSAAGGRKRKERPPLDPVGQLRAKEKVQRTDRALARSQASTAEQTTAADAAARRLDALAGERPEIPAALAGWLSRTRRLEDYEDKLEALERLLEAGGRTAEELAYLDWLRRSWSLRHEATEAADAVRAGDGERGNLRTAKEAGEAELREKSRDLLEVMRRKGPNYRDKCGTEVDEVLPEEVWEAIPSEERPALDTDHLVALDRITKLDEIVPLLRIYVAAPRVVKAQLMADLEALGDRPANLVRMNASANRSKNNRSWYAISYEDAARYGYRPAEVNRMRVEEDKQLAAILVRIQELVDDYGVRVRGAR